MAVKRYDISKEFLGREYVKKGRSLRDIAADFGCDKSTISYKLREFRIPVRKRSEYAPVFNSASEEFLEREYTENRRSSTQIADELGCSHATIINVLRKRGIAVRGNVCVSEDFLNNEYVVLRKTARQIADDVGCDKTTILRRMKYFGIQPRPYGTQIGKIELSDGLLEYLDGTMLGDGYMGKQSELSAHYSLTQKHREYTSFVADYLGKFGVDCCPIYDYSYIAKNGKRYSSSKCLTHSYAKLIDQHKRWYNGNIKIVPSDVRLTPMSLRTWYLEDGGIDKSGDCVLGQVALHTCSFTKEEVTGLIDRLKQLLDTDRIHLYMSKGIYPTICFAHRDVVRKFFDYMAPLPDELKGKYGYKYL